MNMLRNKSARANQPMTMSTIPSKIGFLGPTLSSNRPAIGASIAPMAAPGNMIKPAVKASLPKTIWTKLGKTNDTPKSRNWHTRKPHKKRRKL